MKIFKAIVLFLLILLVGYGFYQWEFCRIYIEPGKSLQLRYKGGLSAMIGFAPKAATPGQFAQPGEVGILEEMVGPGRHFFNPIYYDRTVVEDKVIEPGEVGIVTSKLGEQLPQGEFLVDGDLGTTKNKGVLRKAFAAGRYRYNPYAYEFQVVKVVEKQKGTQKKISGWVNIPTGFVGVVTNLAANPITKAKQGIQEKVLPPGIYPINGEEQEVDIVEIGMRETSVKMDFVFTDETKKFYKVDEAGEPVLDMNSHGIAFPSADGFRIFMDFTAIWGLMPEQAPDAIRSFGNVDAIEEKVLIPQIESISRNHGSAYKAVDLLVGEERGKFQDDVVKAFHQIFDEKGISLQRALVRNIYIPAEVRLPIQQAFVADELTLTRNQEQDTAQEEAKLREAEKQVDLEKETVDAETKKLVAEKLAEGAKTVAETEATTLKITAAVEKQTAATEAEATVVKGQAEADGKKLLATAEATRFAQAVGAFGSPGAYNSWTFANGLPEKIDLKLFYSGVGTLWTDAKNMSVIVPQPQAKK
jgi:regulator of protease activity HflC (stomatin/prohibitin superfamily)